MRLSKETHACSDEDPCPLHGGWGAVRPLVREAFSELTVAALAERPSRLHGKTRAGKAQPRATRPAQR